jgi:hypothetical protein
MESLLTPFHGILIGIGLLLVVVVWFYLHKVHTKTKYMHGELTRACNALAQSSETVSKVTQAASEALDAVRELNEAERRKLDTVVTHASASVEKFSKDSAQLTQTISKHSKELTDRAFQFSSASADLKKKINILSDRSVHDQLSTYPRKFRFVNDEGELALDPFSPGSHHVETLTAQGENLHIALVCEAHSCSNTMHTERTRFQTAPIKLPKEKVRFNSHWLLDPNNKDNLKHFFHVLEGSGIVDHGARTLEHFIENHHQKALALIGVHATITLGYVALPMYLTSVIVVQEMIQHHLAKLRRERRDADATKIIRNALFNRPFDVKDVGGPGHLHFGEWLRRQGEKSNNVYGDLTRWLDPETNQFAWLCPSDAYAQISKYTFSHEQFTNSRV